jgi:hypothetical protein
MSPHPEHRADAAAARKVAHLLAGDYLLYELTADREMRVLHLPRRISSRLRTGAGSAGPASRRAGGGATPAP